MTQHLVPVGKNPFLHSKLAEDHVDQFHLVKFTKDVYILNICHVLVYLLYNRHNYSQQTDLSYWVWNVVVMYLGQVSSLNHLLNLTSLVFLASDVDIYCSAVETIVDAVNRD